MGGGIGGTAGLILGTASGFVSGYRGMALVKNSGRYVAGIFLESRAYCFT